MGLLSAYVGMDHYFSGGMRNTCIEKKEKNCLQGLKRQNKLFANAIYIKNVCRDVR